MKIAIMQPYFFPYIGYFQLINAVDKFVIYDDVNFIKSGWINRNKILINNKSSWFTMHLIGASSNKEIYNISINNKPDKLLSTIKHNYIRAPYFKSTFIILEKILNTDLKNLAEFISFSLTELCLYLGISTEFFISSKLKKYENLKKEERIINICKYLKADAYINLIGGIDLYSKKNFSENNIELWFISTDTGIKYNQFNHSFVPGLSIIDVMMFNSKKEIHGMLSQYKLI